jgi:hypothetical protein
MTAQPRFSVSTSSRISSRMARTRPIDWPTGSDRSSWRGAGTFHPAIHRHQEVGIRLDDDGIKRCCAIDACRRRAHHRRIGDGVEDRPPIGERSALRTHANRTLRGRSDCHGRLIASVFVVIINEIRKRGQIWKRDVPF